MLKENKNPSVMKKPGASTLGQKSILGFFTKKAPAAVNTQVNGVSQAGPKEQSGKALSSPALQSPTPAPSSDLPEPPSESEEDDVKPRKLPRQSFPTPITPHTGQVSRDKSSLPTSSPSSRNRKSVNYAESDSEDETKASKPTGSRRKLVKRRRTSESSIDNFAPSEVEISEDDFIDDDDLLEAEATKVPGKRTKVTKEPPRTATDSVEPLSPLNLESIPPTTTQWKFEADQMPADRVKAPQASGGGSGAVRQKAYMTEPDQRYPWLADIMDIDRRRPGDAQYDPRTLFIPPLAWSKFSPFEKQYWEIKQHLWDTIVFFKKGKFYELYENDATIGHQMFDLKLTDRVNMRMVGVPESSLDMWANQFVAKGYKIARVDQMESALGKEMRQRSDGKPRKEEKVIQRQLACILTAGTLVDAGMLKDDMNTYCLAVKESVVDDSPFFGIAFVDAATGQFFLSEFLDDADLTKFETLIAQIRPMELLLEKSLLSSKATRILKSNTSPTTIWNFLKPEKEFWGAAKTAREVDAAEYFVKNEHGDFKYPPVLQEAREKEILFSAFGALVSYLRVLKIDRDLISLGNVQWYHPLRSATSLVLDGQSLINLEVLVNSSDGSTDGTLFNLLNRCITPFGKRLFKQWVCHPLIQIEQIEARLDAVDALNADSEFQDRFSASLSKVPDLERLISRVHAGQCKAKDFIRVLEGFEQIEYTVELLRRNGSGEGLIGQLLKTMPDLTPCLKYWKTCFDRPKAREHGILVPEQGIELDFDESQEHIQDVHNRLDELLQKMRRRFSCSSICYRDNGKEIYQLEVPNKVKGIPDSWDQMSATKAVKRYYSPELRTLVRELLEAQETHAQIVKAVAGRFFARFDEEYTTWLGAINVIAHLDCLISLARASKSLGEPSCRPSFIEASRTTIDFEDLRHPCMLLTANEFIPNDVRLGGTNPNINLLTGANAAGKSTVLRMTCIAIIMAQIGCYVPCSYARLTPVDRIMSRLGANDNIFAAQSTFFVELAETKKILTEATSRSLVILDELGRGTSSYDGIAVAEAVLHHIATHIGCVGFFATHYHSLAEEFSTHPEVVNKRMRILVDDVEKKVTFLYKLENGIAEGSFGMHCASMCGISDTIVARAEEAAKDWEHTSRLKESLEKAREGSYIPLGLQSDLALLLDESKDRMDLDTTWMNVLAREIETL